MNPVIKEKIKESIDVKKAILEDEKLLDLIQKTADAVKDAVFAGNKVLLCGNGGSASDALHIAGEFVGRFQKDRQALPAISLNADVASLTSIANDFGYDHVYERGVEGYGKSGDVLIGISTSGNSKNVCMAIEKARSMDITTVAFTGMSGGKMAEIADIAIVVPSSCTARIQEAHIMIGHIVCELAEE